MTRLVLIRHGETEWNVIGRYQGQEDPPLNERGFEQAHELAAKAAGLKLDLLYSSPLARAAQTAEILAQALDLRVLMEPRLMEIHQGAWQGKLRQEIEERFPDLFERWQMEPWFCSPPEGESLRDVQVRVEAALEDIAARHPRESIGIVSHRIPIAMAMVRFAGLDPDEVRRLQLPNMHWQEFEIHSDSTLR